MKTSISGSQKRHLALCFTGLGLFMASAITMILLNDYDFFYHEPYFYVIKISVMMIPFLFMTIGTLYSIFDNKRRINIRWIPFIFLLLQAGLIFLGYYGGSMFDCRPRFTDFFDSVSVPWELHDFYQSVFLGIAILEVIIAVCVLPLLSQRWIVRTCSIVLATAYGIFLFTELYSQSVSQIFRPSVLIYVLSLVMLELSLFHYGEYLREDNKFPLSAADFITFGLYDEYEEDKGDDGEDYIESQYSFPSDIDFIYAFAFIFDEDDLLQKISVLADIARANLTGIGPQYLTDDALISIGESLLEAVININSITDDLIGDSTISLIKNIISEDSTSLIRRISIVHLVSDFLQTDCCLQRATAILCDSIDIDFV